MSAVVKATCWLCGDVEMAAGAVRVTHINGREGVSRCDFSCTECGHTNSKPLTETEVRALRIAGAQVIEIAVPKEDLERDTSGPALSYDDLLDLHDLLEANDNVIALALAQIEPPATTEQEAA